MRYGARTFRRLARWQPAALAACLLGAAGCGPWAGQWENWGNSRKDNEAAARYLAPQAFVYQATRHEPGQPFQALPGQSVELGGRQWVVAPGQQRLPDRLVTAAGSADGVQVFRLSWDDAPYDRLYVQRAPGSYSELR
jgi:hypothetical protein